VSVSAIVQVAFLAAYPFSTTVIAVDVFFPLLAAVVYLVARGWGMSERQSAAFGEMNSAQDDYIKSVARTS
jgi:cytochrome bd-type quinol oxidase subunit 2